MNAILSSIKTLEPKKSKVKFTEEQLEAILDPTAMTEPGIPGQSQDEVD